MQVAIITGSGQGVGAAAAKLFAEHGAKVVVSDIDAAKAQQARRLPDGNVCLYLCCDRHAVHISQHGAYRLQKRSRKLAAQLSPCLEM